MNTTERRKNYTPEQKEAERDYKRRHYQATREKQLAYAEKYRAENEVRLRQECIGSYQRRKEYFDAYRAANAEKISKRRAAWRDANQERVASVNAAYLQANLERHRANQHNRRARKAENGGQLSTDIVQRLFALQRGKCACCKLPLGGSYDLDHVFPIALGGPNSDDNVQLLRARCNRQKGAKHPVHFMQTRGFLL